MQRYAVAARVFDAAQVQNLGAACRQVEHFFARDDIELAGAGQDARVGGEDPVDVGIDLAHVGAQGRRERRRGRVGAAATERGDVLGRLAHSLEPSHDGDMTGAERLGDPARGDVEDARIAVVCVGDDPRL